MIARSTVTSLEGRAGPIRRLAVLGAALLIVFGLLATSAAGPSWVRASNTTVVKEFRITTIPAQTAGAGFTVTVEARDFDGDNARLYNGANAVLSGLGDSPNGTHPSYGTKSWSNGVGIYTGVKAVLATSSATITVTDATKSLTKTSNAFIVKPGALASFTLSNVADVAAGATIPTITARAFDAFGNAKTDYSGGTLSTTMHDAPNGCSGCTASAGSLGVWASGVASINGAVGYKAETARTITIQDGAISRASNSFAVTGGPLTQLTFTGQPLDAKVGTSITSSYVPTAPVKVFGSDDYGNIVSGANVAMSSSVSLGANTTASTGADGVASFSSLSIAQTGTYVLTATSGAATKDSLAFNVVNELGICDGTTCTNSASSGGAQNQLSYTSINTNGDFDNHVILTTQFVPQRLTGTCAGADSAFGQTTITRVQGTGVTATQPDFKVAIIYPKETLQALGLTSRNADSFNICLGAARLDGGTSGWLAKPTSDATAPSSTPNTADGNGDYWGWVPDCTSALLAAHNPCVTLKTKNASALQAELGLSNAQFRALGFKSSDLAVVFSKPYPFDGKVTMK